MSNLQLEQILDMIGSSWFAGLPHFCDTNNIEESKRCPVACNLLLEFLCSCTGSYSGSMLVNYTVGLRAWHLLHGREWLIPPRELKVVLDRATTSAPEQSKQKKHLPFTPAFLTAICDQLNLTSLLDTAVFVCLIMTFYSMVRLGEFTAAQDGLTDPKAAFKNHFRVNPTENLGQTHLFAWKHFRGMCLLSKKDLLKRIMLAAAAGLPSLKGHEYMLYRVPFDIVKTIGRWSEEVFTIYLREHAIILTPYIQASPVLKLFIQYTMPHI
ncbi:hypothetical protein BDR06DRAFT_984509 [Suillus hirtellus]|nr:hypothetical protein BDR06DRAFT_984509 [Suillus hirtellus]